MKKLEKKIKYDSAFSYNIKSLKKKPFYERVNTKTFKFYFLQNKKYQNIVNFKNKNIFSILLVL